MTEKKLKYQKPAMQVYVMKQQCRLLAGSGQGEDFNWDEEP